MTPADDTVGPRTERAFQIDLLRVHMTHGYRVAYYAAYFGVGASFEVFSLTLLLTGILLASEFGGAWWAVIAIYLVTGIAFVAYGVYGFGRTRRMQETDLRALAERYA